ncbi:sulfocyanin-like copper-binding protein [Streptomyces laurentii]|uniref:sulfocyanin-like copper-binding protein n=1 Tax=Streptomyces laurentii TaxID=39478 RepID=UPI00369BF8EA
MKDTIHTLLPNARRRMVFGLTATGMTALLAACGANNGGGGTTTTTPPPSAAAGTPVAAKLVDFRITLSTHRFTAGPYTFTAKNDGKTEHALEVEGNGADHRTPGIMPGHSATLTVNLESGTYEVYCPIDGHKELGMKADITVGAAHAAVNKAPAHVPAQTPAPGNGY